MKSILCFALATITYLASTLLATAQCPPCYRNQPRLIERNGYGTSGRPIARIAIDQSTFASWQLGTAMGAAEAAAREWTDGGGPYEVERTNDLSTADFIVQVGSPNGGIADIRLDTHPHIIRVSSTCAGQVVAQLQSALAHELGHRFGLENSDQGPGGCPSSETIMGPADPNTCTAAPEALRVSSSDINQSTASQHNSTSCTIPSPSTAQYPSGPPTGGGHNCGGIDCHYPYTCRAQNSCTWYDPTIIDTEGDGFELTDGDNGVTFDIDGDDTKEPMSWTITGTDDAWLVLDINGNGTIDNGKELFSNFTPQPKSDNAHGFIALAEHDNPANGGNGDGEIDGRDSVFNKLRLWKDLNQNGISDADELFMLPSLDIASISLDWRESRRRDRHGNQFRYRAKVEDARKAKVGRWAYDVVLLPPRPSSP